MKNQPTGVEVVLGFLRGLDLGVPVVSRVPATRPPEFIRVTQAGVRRTNVITDRSLVVVQTYAPGVDRAWELAQTLREKLIDELELLPNVFGWEEQSGPVEFPDPDLPTVFRIQMTGYLLQALA